MNLKRDRAGFTRYARFANQVLFQLLYQHPERGFNPLCDYPASESGGYAPRARNPDFLQDVIAAKDRVVVGAEQAAERGQPWDDEDFKDQLYTTLEDAIGVSPLRKPDVREPGEDDES